MYGKPLSREEEKIEKKKVILLYVEYKMFCAIFQDRLLNCSVKRKWRERRDGDKAVRVREEEGTRGRMNVPARTIDEKRRVVAFLGKSVQGVA